MDVFVSRPTWVAEGHRAGLEGFLRTLAAHGLHARTLGSTDYPSKCPLDDVIELMDECKGAIILGFPQIVITSGTLKDESISCAMSLSTEWNHIEAGLAYARGLPLLVIHDERIGRGIFDRGAISTFLHQARFSDPAWPLAAPIQGALKKWKRDCMESRSD